MAGEALSAVSAFVDGVFPGGTAGLGWLRRLDGWVVAAAVGCLPAGVAAVALVGPPVQRLAAGRAPGRCHAAVTGRVFRH